MPIGRYEHPEIRRLRNERSAGRLAGRPVDQDIASVAALQGGVIHRDQLRGLGLGGRAVDHRVARGKLHRTGRMTYGVGHRRNDLEAHLHTALLVAGDGAALSHRTSGAELGFMSVGSTPVSITVPRQRRPPSGVRYHRRVLPDDEIVFQNGFALTSVGRTLFDIAGLASEFVFRRAVKEVSVQKLHCWPTLPDLLKRHPRSPGAARIRTVIAESGPPPSVVLTDGEERFLALVRKGGLPEPSHHYGIGLADDWFEVDFAWPALGIAVEVDSSFHEIPIALETDHARDQRLLAAGWRVFRVTWRQLYDDPGAVLRRFRAFYESVVTGAPYPGALVTSD